MTNNISKVTIVISKYFCEIPTTIYIVFRYLYFDFLTILWYLIRFSHELTRLWFSSDGFIAFFNSYEKNPQVASEFFRVFQKIPFLSFYKKTINYPLSVRILFSWRKIIFRVKLLHHLWLLKRILILHKIYWRSKFYHWDSITILDQHYYLR